MTTTHHSRTSAPRTAAATASAAALCLGLLLCDVLFGGSIPPRDVLSGFCAPSGDYLHTIVWSLRLPRAVCALLCGAALSLGGAQMQALFRNPLSDPHIMGVSGGAGLAAAISTMAFGGAGGVLSSTLPTAAAALLGAGAASAIVLTLARRCPRAGVLLLCGVMLGFIFSAATTLVAYGASEESLKLFYSWSAGSFQGGGWSGNILLAVALVLGTILALCNLKGLDLILFGEEYAALCGASVRRITVLSMVSCCLLAGAATAVCGPLGFVGIVAPHLARQIGGTSLHRRVLPLAMLLGSAAALLADILSHAFGPLLPVGGMTALLGIPVILWMLLHPAKDGPLDPGL